MSIQYTIRGVLESLVSGKITIDKAETLLKQKIRREGFYKGAEVLKNSFKEIYNEIERRIENNEGENFRGRVSLDGNVTVTTRGDGSTD